MGEVLLSEARPVIALWFVMLMVVLVWAVFYFIAHTKKFAINRKAKEKGMRVFYSVISFVLIWMAMLPFFICMVFGEKPDIQGVFFAIIVFLLAIGMLLNLKSRRRK